MFCDRRDAGPTGLRQWQQRFDDWSLPGGVEEFHVTDFDAVELAADETLDVAIGDLLDFVEARFLLELRVGALGLDALVAEEIDGPFAGQLQMQRGAFGVDLPNVLIGLTENAGVVTAAQ